MVRKSVLLILLLILFQNNLFALETDTHEALNSALSNITTPEGFNIDSYLKNNLGLSQGIYEVVLENKKILEWLRAGGKYEDKPPWTIPYIRSINHFHEPISNKGLKGTANSSLQWALMSKGTQSTGGNYSWFDARDYFYQALTSKDKNTRNDYFGKTFRALGQLTHLVQDLSVPAHTRDDGHIVTTSLAGNYQYYEKWVKANANISNLASNPVFFDLSVLSQTNPLGSVPVANLFDTNKFTGADSSVSTQKNIGLSEYTNPNFLSDDTIFTDDFVYPSKKWLELWTDDSVKRKYLRKMSEGEPVNHLAAVSWLYFYRLRYFPQEDQYLPVGLDPECHKEYSEKLIPHAVGYSAGLLNYFFRGEIDMAIDDTARSGYVIKNNSDEDMNGTFELWYDNTEDKRVKLKEWSLDIKANDKSKNITFSLPDDAKEFCKYILVFKGQLGQEQDAVVGKVVEKVGCNGRTVTLSAGYEYWKGNMYCDGLTGDIHLVTDSGSFLGHLPDKYTLYKGNTWVISVRFDQDDWNTMIVLTRKNEIYDFHKFEFDGEELKYKGIIESSPLVTYSDATEEFDHSDYCWSEEGATCPSLGYNCTCYEGVYTTSGVTKLKMIYDFFVQGSTIKPFYKTYESQTKGDRIRDYCLGYDRPCDGYTEIYSGDWLTYQQDKQEIYYGSSSIDQSTSECVQPNTWSGAGEWNCYIGWTPAYRDLNPGYIFNENDCSYSDAGTIESTFSLPTSDITEVMIRDDGGYSFYNSSQSFSSEIGSVDCSGFLLNKEKLGFLVNDSGGGLVKFNSCSDYKIIGLEGQVSPTICDASRDFYVR